MFVAFIYCQLLVTCSYVAKHRPNRPLYIIMWSESGQKLATCQLLFLTLSTQHTHKQLPITTI